MRKILQIENLTIGYKQRRKKTVVAQNINVHLNGGELVCLLGPNGAGKSTLMRTISGSQQPLACCSITTFGSGASEYQLMRRYWYDEKGALVKKWIREEEDGKE